MTRDPAPLVTVILPVRDRAGSIARAIRSVLDQTYQRLELVVIDDGSRDDTVAIVESFGERVRLIRQDAAGAYVARNTGVAQANGSLIAFADSDDAWYPDKLAAQVALFDDRAVGLVYGDVRHVDATGTALGRTSFQRSPPARGEALARLADCNFVPTPTVVVRRDCLVEIGGFDVEQRLSADYLAWFRIAERHLFDYVRAPVADYAVHPGGISADLGRSLIARITLFSRYRSHHPQKRVRWVLAILLVELAISLMIAAGRGRGKAIKRPFRSALSTMTNLPVTAVASGAIRFIALRMRTRLR